MKPEPYTENHDSKNPDIRRLSNKEVEQLLNAALTINDKLDIETDHVEFSGSVSDAEAFRDLVNQLWHRYQGWVR